MRFDCFGYPIALLDRDAKLLFETVDGAKKRETLTDCDYTDILEGFIIEQDENIASDAVALEVPGIFGEAYGGKPVDDLLFGPFVDVDRR